LTAEGLLGQLNTQTDRPQRPVAFLAAAMTGSLQVALQIALFSTSGPLGFD
jgi:hypothetical protein